jgi:hypothetical protein
MADDRRQVATLLTAAELGLFEASLAAAPGPKTAISKKARIAPAKGGPAPPGTRDPSAAKRRRANVGRTRAVSKRNQARHDKR